MAAYLSVLIAWGEGPLVLDGSYAVPSHNGRRRYGQLGYYIYARYMPVILSRDAAYSGLAVKPYVAAVTAARCPDSHPLRGLVVGKKLESPGIEIIASMNRRFTKQILVRDCD